MTKLISMMLMAFLLSACSICEADQIVHNGSLSGELGIEEHEILIDQFNDLDGIIELNFVQLDFLTSLIGGGTSNGSNVPTNILALLSAEYFLDNATLADTEALIDTVIPNIGSPGSFTVFDTSTEQVILNTPVDVAPWMGNGQILLTAITEFVIEEDPPGSVGFSAGGTVNYTVTYDFNVIPLLGDVNLDGEVDLLDVALFVDLIVMGSYQAEADTNLDGTVNLLDVDPFIAILAGG